ncbi:MAG: PAS domain S-box protein [Phycisphaerales bacterium]|nr:MAG: PAS domain S-box protein [Phycisphaerales bacterium]
MAEERARQAGDVNLDLPKPGEATAGPSDSVDFRRAFEMAADAILITDAQGRYVRANKRACELTGYSANELTQMRIGDLCVPFERAYSLGRFELLRKSGATCQERVIQRRDGTRLTVEAHATGLGDGTFQTILRDVSDRVSVEDALRHSADTYGVLMDPGGTAVVSAGRNGRIVSWSSAAEEIFGYTAEEAVGMPVTRLIPRRWKRQHTSTFNRHVGVGTGEQVGRTIHTEGLRRDGAKIPLEISVAVGWKGDEPLFTAVVRDMSRQREVIESLNDAFQRLQFHIERMPLAYIVWDTDFRVVEWNPSAEQMFGYSRSEAAGRTSYELVLPADPEVIAAVDKVWSDLLAGDTSSHSVNANVRKDGSTLTCEWFNTPLRDSEGKIRGVASMARDVSEREASEAQLRNAQKLESLGVLASGVAHDFNSSLMVILGNTSLLKSMSNLPSKALEYVELIENAGVRAGEFITHLLAYARTGRHNPQPTDLNAVLNDAAEFVRSAIGKRHELALSLMDRLPRILADHSQIEQVVLNLCLNARQAQPKQGVITVVTRVATLTGHSTMRCVPVPPAQGRYVELVVQDDGCGMDEATAQRIFDPFFTTKTEGHGLGMAAVLGILRHHNAVAHVDSKLGKGTKIHVYFPIHSVARGKGVDLTAEHVRRHWHT